MTTPGQAVLAHAEVRVLLYSGVLVRKTAALN